MTLVSRPLHGIIDYTMGASLAALPFLLRTGPRARRLFLALAAGHVAYSLITDYEVGAVRKIPFRGHMALDGLWALGLIAAGALMKSEPRHVRATMAAVGASELGALALTDADASSQAEALAR
jgi:hypothetical protein